MKDLSPIITLFFSIFKTTQHEVLICLANFNILRKFDSNFACFSDFLNQLFERSISQNIPGDPFGDEKISNNSKRPDIAFVGIEFLIENLWGHEGQGANNSFHSTDVFRILTKIEISDFDLFIVYEDVVWF